MDENKLLIPAYYIHQISDELVEKGVDVKKWLAGAGLTSKIFSELNQVVSFIQFKKLITSAMRLSNEPSIGLKVGKKLGLTAHGMLGYAIIASGSVREMVEIFSRYLNTRTPLLRVSIEPSKQVLKVNLHECYPLNEIKVPFIESVIFTFYNLLMQVTQNKAPIAKISFPYQSTEYQSIYHSSFNFPIEFDQQVAHISLIQSEIDQPLLMRDQASLKQAKSICEQELEKLQNAESQASKIRKYLLTFNQKLPNLIQVAQFLNLSQRTLHRRLENENTSFSKVIKDVKCFKSSELLINTQMTVQEIAFSMGYSDVANFRKAFKNWMGISPKEYRARPK